MTISNLFKKLILPLFIFILFSTVFLLYFAKPGFAAETCFTAKGSSYTGNADAIKNAESKALAACRSSGHDNCKITSSKSTGGIYPNTATATACNVKTCSSAGGRCLADTSCTGQKLYATDCSYGEVCCNVDKSQCQNGSKKCQDGNSAKYLSCEKGVWKSYYCASGKVCSSGKCITKAKTCDQLKGRCVADTSCTGQKLNGTGCSYSEVCCNVNSNQCTTGQKKCQNGNSNQILTCNKDHVWVATNCATGEVCSSGKCVKAKAPTGPCATKISGKYVKGWYCPKPSNSKSTLYYCDGKGKQTKSKSCSKGCQVNKGTADSCKVTTPPPPTTATCKAGTGSKLASCGGHASYACTSSTTCIEKLYKCSTDKKACSIANGSKVDSAKCAKGSICNSSAACATGQITPHFECKNNACVSVKTCGANDSGCTKTSATCGVISGDIILSFTIGLDGLGNIGIRTNRDPLNSNPNPLTKTRTLTVEVYDQSSKKVVETKTGDIQYDANKKFSGNVNLGSALKGSYYFMIKVDGYVKELLPGGYTIGTGLATDLKPTTATNKTPNVIPTVNLVTGDINKDNYLSILDYNILAACTTDEMDSNLRNETLCESNPEYKKLSDLWDDNNVENDDLLMFASEWSLAK